MTREEAIERIKTRYDKWALDDKDLEAIQCTFPELTESEDERIRKELVAVLKDLILPDDQRRRFLDYLERQKKNIEKEYVFRPLAGTDITIAAEQAIRSANKGDRLVLAFNGAYIPVRKGCDANKIVDIYNTFIEKQKEQTPAEWNNATINGEPIPTETQSVDISLAEWSKEDKQMIERLITRLNWITFNTRTDCTSSNITFFDEINWLKSLRPQPKRDCKGCAMFLNGKCTKPHWKPSEEQVEALGRAVKKLAKSDVADSVRLSIIYDNLKKLKEDKK